MQLRYAILFVKDLAAMTAFYRDTLGLKLVDGATTEGWVEFTGGLALHQIPAPFADGMEVAAPPRVREENPVKLVFEVADVEAERVRLAALGVVLMPRPWGACDGVDAEGNVFQIAPPR
jgi:catechol 2,3-dioxygenase-like lactoylglutathione lyase family enzyme